MRTATRRGARGVASIFALALMCVGVSVCAESQCPALRRGEAVPDPPKPDAPRVLVPTFHGDPSLGASFSEALRERLILVTDEKKLWVIRCTRQNELLTAAGVKPDTALGPTQLGDLGRNLGATESLDGDIEKGSDGQIHVRTRLYYSNFVKVHEDLPEATAKNVDDLADKVAKIYVAARPELEPYGKCSNLARDRKGDSALVFARAARAAYPAGYLPRVCSLNAWGVVPNAPADSLKAAAEAVLAVDTVNRFAVATLAYAYQVQGDTENAVRYYLRYWDLDHSDAKGAQTVISVLTQSGAADRALPIIDLELKTSPADTGLLRTKLRILLDDQRFRDAYPVFDTLLKADTSKAVRPMFQRMIGAAQRDSNQQRVLEYRAQQTKRFPDDADSWEGYAVALFHAGRVQESLDAAKRAVAADPKVPDGFGFVFTVLHRQNLPDSVIAFGKQALGEGADSTMVGTEMASVIGPYAQRADSLKHANDPGAKDAWQATFTVASRIDSIVPAKLTKYFIGLSAAQIGLIGLEGMAQIQEVLKTNVPEACKQLGDIDDWLTLARLDISQGGSVQPAVATQIMNLVTENQPNLQAFKASKCK